MKPPPLGVWEEAPTNLATLTRGKGLLIQENMPKHGDQHVRHKGKKCGEPLSGITGWLVSVIGKEPRK